MSIRNAETLLQRIRAIHEHIRDAVLAACERMAVEQLAAIDDDAAEGDTIFAIDRISEETLLEHFGSLAQEWSCVLVAEGLNEQGETVLPRGLAASEAELRIIVDPIDGTRGIMYQKRPAWILTGVAPNRGPDTTLADIELAVQTEIPLLKQHLSDSLWAIAGQGAGAERYNRLSGERRPLTLMPTRARTIAHGYGALARYFPGSREQLGAIDDALVERVLGPLRPGKAETFEDQYICTAGQIYELLVGHDRWFADLRALLGRGMSCHPYDLCTELIGRELGVSICDPSGRLLSAPLNTSADVAWVGYANAAIRQQVEPALTAELIERGLLPAQGGAHVAH